MKLTSFVAAAAVAAVAVAALLTATPRIVTAPTGGRGEPETWQESIARGERLGEQLRSLACEVEEKRRLAEALVDGRVTMAEALARHAEVERPEARRSREIAAPGLPDGEGRRRHLLLHAENVLRERGVPEAERREVLDRLRDSPLARGGR